MNYFTAALLGIVQGLTEFLPLSSSGHLVIAQHIVPGFSQPGVFFDAILHAGTLMSVFFFFKGKLVNYFKKHAFLIIIATIPAFMIGFLFQSVIEGFFESIRVVGFALLLTGIMNFLTDKAKPKRKKISQKDSLLVGIFQGVSLIPGISRSGATIFSASTLGIDKRKAAEFSFIISIPAVVGANILQTVKHGASGGVETGHYLIGFMTAFISGYLAIFLVFDTLKKGKFKVFAAYCILLGGIILAI